LIQIRINPADVEAWKWARSLNKPDAADRRMLLEKEDLKILKESNYD
jgi:hypothetical protein